VWSVGEKGKQYIGSTINQYARFCDHVSCFTGDGSKKGCLMHKWVLETNSLHLCHWHSVYNCFNFYLEFIKQNPTYELSPQEIWALKCLTEFFPRILEQSLLSQKSFKGWNKQDKVQFYFNARSEGLTTKKQITRDPKYLLVDAQTKKCLVKTLYFCDQAAAVIGTKNTRKLSQKIKRNERIYSKTFKKPVLLVPYISNPSPLPHSSVG
jgi:hypothetical protein